MFSSIEDSYNSYHCKQIACYVSFLCPVASSSAKHLCSLSYLVAAIIIKRWVLEGSSYGVSTSRKVAMAFIAVEDQHLTRPSARLHLRVPQVVKYTWSPTNW